MFNSAKHIDHYVSDILDYTVLCDDQNQLIKENVIFEVQEAFEQVIEIEQDKITLKNLDIQFEFLGFSNKLLVKTDKKRLQQVFMNIFSNAVKFTEKDGIIMILTELMSDHKIKVSVSDTGKGIKEEDQENLFKLFGNRDENDRVTTNGIGFGLLICKLIVNHFQGIIDFDSVWEEGSTFFFTFELCDFNPDDYVAPMKPKLYSTLTDL